MSPHRIIPLLALAALLAASLACSVDLGAGAAPRSDVQDEMEPQVDKSETPSTSQRSAPPLAPTDPPAEHDNPSTQPSPTVPPPTADPCPGAIATRLAPGMQARVVAGGESRLWAEPNHAPELARLPGGTEFEVLNGPVCVEAQGGHLNTWFVALDDGFTGWISEGYADQGYWIEPVP